MFAHDKTHLSTSVIVFALTLPYEQNESVHFTILTVIFYFKLPVQKHCYFVVVVVVCTISCYFTQNISIFILFTCIK